MNTLKELKVKNRVFYIITSLDYGGTQRQLYFLIKTLIEIYNFDYEVFVISLKKLGRFEKKFKGLGVKVYNLGFLERNKFLNFLFLPFALIKLVILFLMYNPKIVHSFLFQANFFARFLKIFNPKITLICSERVAEKQKKWQKTFLKYTNFLVDKFVVNSYDLKKFISISQRITPDKIEVIPNMLLEEEIKLYYSSEQIRKSLGIDEECFLVLSVGRLHKQKGFDLLLEIVRKFVDEIETKRYLRKVLFAIVGDGEEMNFLIKRVKYLDIEKFVKFVGYKENVYDYINACNLFLLTSYWEGSPNVVLEAIYLRKPVISTYVEGVSDYLNENYIVSLKKKRECIISEFVLKILEFYLDNNKDNFKKCLKNNFDISCYKPELIVKKYCLLYS